ncbi:MAG: DUF1538 domain-containing protein [Eubacteriales bacterium]
MKKKRLETLVGKIKESCMSVLPISLIILLLSFTVCPLPNGIFIAFVVGTCLLTVGLGLFSLGAELSMERIGGHIGANLTKSRNIPIIAIISLIVGVLITISEPDLHVLAGYTGEQKFAFILAVAAGLGVFLVIAVMRIIFSVKFKYIIAAGYGVIVILAVISYLVDPKFLAIAFDAGGVTTGAMSVPFVMSIGAGIAAISSQNEDDSSFGLMSVCSIGPIISVLTMGLAGGFENIAYAPHAVPEFLNSQEMGLSFLSAIPTVVRDVLMGLVPIIAFFLIYQFFTVRVQKKEMAQIFIGAAYTFFGMVLFLVGVNVGFMPVGSYLGSSFGKMGALSWVVIPVGMIIGFCMTYAEPAVGVLNKQVEEATSGAIPPKVIPMAMAVGVALASGIAMLRALTGISILPFLTVGYIIAVIMAFICPGLFSSIAFDAGGVASGVMTAAFLLPLAIGICEVRGAADAVMTDAFGTIALVAMAPLISIQTVGIIYKFKQKGGEGKSNVGSDTDVIEIGEQNERVLPDYDTEIIEFSLDVTKV